jgi:hypothetical protein
VEPRPSSLEIRSRRSRGTTGAADAVLAASPRRELISSDGGLSMIDDRGAGQSIVGRWAMQGFLVVGIVAGFLLVYQHWTHVVSYLPWLIVVFCPLMHLFMHQGHGHHGGDPTGAEKTSPHNARKRRNRWAVGAAQRLNVAPRRGRDR